MPEPLSPDNKVATPKSAADINDIFSEIDNDDEQTDKGDKGEKDDKSDKKVAKPDKEDKADKKDAKDKDDDTDLDDLELKGAGDEDEDEEKLNLKEDDEVEIDAPPRKKELLKDFPDLFKKHPFLEKMLYRDRQYTELFGSFDDAREIAEKAEVFNQFEQQLLKGSTEEVLKNVKESDPKAFDKIVDTYLHTLAKVDKEAYFDVVGNIGKQMITEMMKEAEASENDNLKQAALILNQFLFATSKFTAPKTRASAESKGDEQSEAEKERLSYVQERFETSQNELQDKVDKVLRATISEYIDPKDSMTPYIKKNAVADALKHVHLAVTEDPSMRKNLDKAWRAAFDAKFSKESLGRIQSLYLGRAKGNLPAAIKKARAEALKDLAPRVKNEEKDEDKEEETPRKRGFIPAGRPSQQRASKDGMKKGESVVDYFSRD